MWNLDTLKFSGQFCICPSHWGAAEVTLRCVREVHPGEVSMGDVAQSEPE